MVNKEHPYADLLRTIASGKVLQLYKLHDNGFNEYRDLAEYEVFDMLSNYSGQLMHIRVKPDPPSDIVTLAFVEPVPKLDNAFNQPNLKLTFDGETKALMKAEVL